MQLLQHMYYMCVNNNRPLDAIIVLNYMRRLNSVKRSPSMSQAFNVCIQWMLAASTFDFFVDLHVRPDSKHKVEITGAILDGAFDEQPLNPAQAIRDPEKLATCLDCFRYPAIEVADTLYILTQSKAAESFLLQAVRKSGVKLYNVSVSSNGFIQKEHRVAICKGYANMHICSFTTY